MSTETPTTANPLAELVNALTVAFQATSAPSSASGFPMAMPTAFAGEAAECSGFLLQVNLFIRMQPQQFTSENAKVAFLISLLTGKALQWAKAIWNSDNPIIHSYEQFTSHFSEVFSTTTDHLSTSDQLFRLQQGNSMIHQYTLHFRTLAAASGWNETTLLGAYRQGLNPRICSAMALYDDSIGLETFLQRTARVSQRLAACQPTITAPQPASVVACTPVPEPMQVDSSRLSRSERNRCMMNGLCLYCGNSGHLLRTCPIRPPRPVVSTLSTEVETASLTLIPVTLHTSKKSLCVSALVDSGSSENFISQACLEKLQLQRCLHKHTLAIKTIQGKPLGCGRIKFSSPVITLQAGLFHTEELRFLVLEGSTVSVILGRPWLQLHHPELSWDPCDIIRWSKHCHTNCLSPEPAYTPEIPAEYMSFQDVFSKQAATQLPPHRPWDCAIDLLPGAQLPKGQVYPLSIPERQAMEEYIKEALQQGFIQPSTSPAASSFFVGKKDGGLRPCIDYRQLNSQIIQQLYPLPLVPAALEELRGAQVFTKLDPRSAYNLVRVLQFLGYVISAEGVQMDQGKVTAIQNWPQPTTIKELQRFLGFSNFYRRFIQNYSSITAPLISLLKGKPRTITWNPAAHEAFKQLKKIFSTAPLLRHPDPQRPFTVEVDASTTGVGAVLSQAVGESSLLHPCAYYSRKLSPAEQNYDVGNRELLAIKLALEEWHHWLEGSTHPFTIITDHKNLQCLREARRLNPRQARWALFFTRFNFITYRPGSKNTVADALSRQYSPDLPTEPETILPSDLIVSPIQWELDLNIQNATLQEPTPPDCPEGKIYVPQHLRLSLLGTALKSLGSGHPGSQRTLSLLQFRYWWPSMRRDTIRYVRSCSVCAMSTSPRQLPTGKLVPLPIPQRPWSHLGVDFVTDLPAAEDNTCILVAVDRFSKMCKFVPLKGLPTAMETAELLFQHLFRHFSLPEEIVLDQGPQFISHVWKVFFKLLDQWPDREKDPGARMLPLVILPQRSAQLGPVPPVGRVCTKLPPPRYHRHDTFPVRTRLPATAVPLDGGTFQRSSCGLLVSGERESVGLSSSPSTAGRATTQALRGHPEKTCAQLPTQGAGLVVDTSPRYIGPFTILRRINDVTVQLQLPPRYRIHPTFHVCLLKPFHPSATEHPGAEVEPPPPEVLDTPSIYTVHEILDSRRRGGHLEYLVDWEGYGPEERSWVARDDILDPSLLTDFHREHLDRPAPHGRGRPRRRVRASEAARGGGGVVSGIHHSLHLTHLLKHHPHVHHHPSTDCLHLHLVEPRPI
ncbi:hypothetical protein M9458_053710 [Cirrhinus mrigala]|uniref:Gypsy retrotransposon integrase-like protein 1 n=1 Tax=Cirrhinus mrigala TaxID=683832 RepID=A0ABD0MLJ4_CIRMR